MRDRWWSARARRHLAFGVLALGAVVAPPRGLDAQQVPLPVLPEPAPAPLALRAPASPVALAFGQAGVALTDADVLFYNPGQLTAARGVAASFQRYGASGNAASVASVQALGNTSIGVGVRMFDASADAGRYSDALRPGLSRLATPGDVRLGSVALTAGAARAVGPVRVGLGATYVRESFRDEVDETALFDVGATLPMGPANVTVAVQQLGSSLRLSGTSANDPWRVVVGAGGRGFPLATFWDLTAATQVALDGEGFVQPAGGVELAWVPLEGVSVVLRTGLRRARTDDERPVTGGLGVALDRYALDYAIEPLAHGVTAHRIGVRIR